jgi:hypothetical protein
LEGTDNSFLLHLISAKPMKGDWGGLPSGDPR